MPLSTLTAHCRGTVLVGEAAQALAPQERGVARGDQHGAGRRTGGLEGDPYGVAGAELLVLHGERDLGHQRLDVGTDLLALVAHHRDDVLRVERLHGPEHVVDHAAARDLVEHLGRLGLHPGPATRRQHDHGQVTRHESNLTSGCPGAAIVLRTGLAGGSCA